jgi:O-antigen ligase
MTDEPTAGALLRAGLAPMLDVAGLVLLTWLGFQVMFGQSQPFETRAFQVGVIGALACLVAPGAIRNLPLPMWAYVAVALLSAAMHPRPVVASADEWQWWRLFQPGVHLVIMTVFVFGSAHLLRTPMRLSVLAVLLVLAIGVLAAQIAFDRVSSNFVYFRGGSYSLPTVAQWSGLHQTGLLLVVALPFAVSIVLLGRSWTARLSGGILAAGLMAVAWLNGSAGGLVAMATTVTAMVGGLLGKRIRRRRVRVVLAVVVLIVPVIALVGLRSSLGPILATGDLAGRVAIWRSAARMAADHIWLGVGPGNYSDTIVAGGYWQQGNAGIDQAHNLILQTATEIGVFGAICLVGVWVWLMVACWRAWSSGLIPLAAFGFLFALAGFLIRSMSDNFLDGLASTDRTRVLVWLLFAAALALGRLWRARSTSIAA